MRTLVIDTASEACSVALFDGDMCIANDLAVIGRGHAERLVPMIAGLPSGGRADRILVGCGPGSFTGVRVGISAARGLGIGWQIPVSGFGSLALVAAGASAGQPLLVVMEGGHGQYLVQSFAADGSAERDARMLDPAVAVAGPTRRVAGNRADAFVECRGYGEAIMALPDARFGMLLDGTSSGWPPQPLYGRAPDAVVKAG